MPIRQVASMNGLRGLEFLDDANLAEYGRTAAIPSNRNGDDAASGGVGTERAGSFHHQKKN